MKYGLAVLIVFSISLSLRAVSGEATVLPAAPAAKLAPVVVKASRVGETPPVRKLAARAAPMRFSGAVRQVPIGRLPRREVSRIPDRNQGFGTVAADTIVQRQYPYLQMPSALTTFEGIGNLDNVLPPDNNGDVGPNHYVEMVNFHFCVYDKTTGANLIAPTLMSALYYAAGFTGVITNTDNGDPIVLYDHLADRWLISQFLLDGVTPDHQEIAISQTADPTGAWWLYDFVMPNNKMNDYPHFGVWSDGYYMTDNQFSNGYWSGAGVFVFDRARMLVGDTNASYQYFDLYSVNSDFGGMLPSDLDGPAPPSNTPNYFAMVDNSAVNPFDAMYIWEFHVDWTNSSNTTFGVNGLPNYTNTVAPFDPSFSSGDYAIPQPGTSAKLDVLSDRLMHRLQYRYWGSYDTLVVCHTVDADTDHAGVRYYQMRRNLPGGAFSIYDQATFAPDANHRWMGSAALDGQGNFAIGYSCSSTGLYPSIRYAGRRSSDPTGSLSQGEATLYAGSGSQTYGTGRWGDYSALSVDPTDDLTFWYVNEYYPATASYAWHTRIGSFRFSTNVGIIGISPSALSWTATSGGANPAAQTFILTNSGGAAFNFTNSISYSVGANGWLSFSAATGSVSARSSLTMTASVAIAGLAAGAYTATNAVSSADATNSPQTLVVTLTVGEALAIPTGVSASDGTYTDKIAVVWNQASGASQYEVWRNGSNDSATASLVATVAVTNYDDTNSLALGANYYYWLKARAGTEVSAFSSPDVGYLGVANYSGTADLSLSSLLLEPVLFSPSAHPELVMLLLNNNGPDALTASRVNFDFYLSANATFGDGDDQWIGDYRADLTLASTNYTTVIVSDAGLSGITIPWNANGYYHVFARARHGGTLYDPDLTNNIVERSGTIAVGESVGQKAPVSGDFDGDGRADPALYLEATGAWYALLSGFGYATVVAPGIGGAGLIPVTADYDGDGKTDPAVYNEATGDWSFWKSGSGYTLSAVNMGALGYKAQAGDFDGLGMADMAVFRAASGYWLILLSESISLITHHFGADGYSPVTGDYDGDGHADLALYKQATGDWMVKLSGFGYTVATLAGFGGADWTPAVADYDGDGKVDLGLYNESAGNWQIRLSSLGYSIVPVASFGGPGWRPVSGDFDGDGKADLVIYEAATSAWIFRLSTEGYAPFSVTF